jgi:hypothetical protein
MTPKPEEKPNGLTREEAQLTLDKILKRYGIHPSDQPGGTRGKTVPLAAPKVDTKGLLLLGKLCGFGFNRERTVNSNA